jgi:hypothetical protein
VQIEPKGPPFREEVFSSDYTRPWGLTSIPLTYDPTPTNQSAPLSMSVVASNSTDLVDCVLQAEPVRQLPNLAQVPILVDTGEASYHAAYDHCTVAFLRQAGVQVEHLELGKAGLHGNGHSKLANPLSSVCPGLSTDADSDSAIYGIEQRRDRRQAPCMDRPVSSRLKGSRLRVLSTRWEAAKTILQITAWQSVLM